jgi:predicted nucleotidyltransferase
MATANPLILSKFRAALDALYGRRIERIVLYGSRARDDAREDSDYDVAVFSDGISSAKERWQEVDRISLAASNITTETGGVIHAMPYQAGSYKEHTPLMHELRREDIDL